MPEDEPIREYAIDDARLAVARGARVLDEQLDEPWWEEIELANLDLSDTRYCIVGQLFTNFFAGIAALIHTENGLPDLGYLGFDRNADFGYHTLALAWGEVIRARERNDGTVPTVQHDN